MSIRWSWPTTRTLVRTGLVMILGAQPDLEVVGQAADGLQRSTWQPGCVPMFCSSTSGCLGSMASR